MNSNDGLAIGVSTDVSGLSTTVYYARSEGDDMVKGEGMTAAVAGTAAMVTMGEGMGVYNERVDANDDGVLDADGTITYTYEVPAEQGDDNYGDPGAMQKRMIVVTYAVDTEADGVTTHGAPTAILRPGDDSATDVSGDEHTVEVDGVNLIITDVDADSTADGDQPAKEQYVLLNDGGTEGTPAMPVPDQVVAGNWTGLGAKVAIPAGEGASISVGYSRMKKDVSADMGSGSATSSKIELDFSYDLGGGATFTAGIDKESNEELRTDGNSFSTTSSGKTTLEAAIS